MEPKVVWIVVEDWALSGEEMSGTHIAGVFYDEEEARARFEYLKEEFLDCSITGAEWVECERDKTLDDHIVEIFDVCKRGHYVTDHETITLEKHTIQ